MDKYLFNSWLTEAWKNEPKDSRPRIVQNQNMMVPYLSIGENIPGIMINTHSLIDPASGFDVFFKSPEAIDRLISEYVMSWKEYYEKENLGKILIKSPKISFKDFVDNFKKKQQISWNSLSGSNSPIDVAVPEDILVGRQVQAVNIQQPIVTSTEAGSETERVYRIAYDRLDFNE